jgi:NAD(P)-dependent dehydrogenase (short-subunit alcohol dehydrogenase family)
MTTPFDKSSPARDERTRAVGAGDCLAGLRVAITGGTSGLGLALVREFLARGARVAFVARGRHRVEQVAQNELAHGIVGDVSAKP